MAITTNDTARLLKSRVRTGSAVLFTAPKSFNLAATDPGWRSEGNLTEIDFDNMSITPIETATRNMSTVKNRNPGSATAQLSATTEDFDVVYGEELANKLELPTDVTFSTTLTTFTITSGAADLLTLDNSIDAGILTADIGNYVGQLLAIPIGTAAKLQTVTRYISSVQTVGADFGFFLENSTCEDTIPSLPAGVVESWCQNVGGSKYQSKQGLCQSSFNDGGVQVMEIFDMNPTEGTMANNDPASANVSNSYVFSINSASFTSGSKLVPRFAKKTNYPGIC